MEPPTKPMSIPGAQSPESTEPTIQIDCAPDGSVTIEGKDFTGADCEKATRFLEEGLGTVATHKKPEFYARNATRNQQQIGGAS